MILTNYFINRELKKLASQAASRRHQYRSLSDITKILFICDAKDWNEARSCIERLKAMNKTVNTAVYAPTAKDVPTWVSNYLLLRADRDINIWGFPDKSLQQQFNGLNADVIIDFTGEKSAAMYYLVLKHPSTFKAGIKSEASAYDFSLIPTTANSNLTYNFDQLLSYLQSITSINPRTTK
ncbi:MAG: hypothetical protein LBT35_06410 [Tannerella sp.]|jgi:hypothetical protein|nr:hypothetical protein [Tannerella sp.]